MPARRRTNVARDRALLLIGFAAGLRRSELVGLDVSDIEIVPQGVVIHLRRSKTDQEGAGRKIGVPFGRTRFCPVMALGHWRERSGIAEGPLFRPVDRSGRIAPARLSGEAVSVIVKALRQTTGHASDAMLARYIRDGEMFVGNAAGALL